MSTSATNDELPPPAVSKITARPEGSSQSSNPRSPLPRQRLEVELAPVGEARGAIERLALPYRPPEAKPELGRRRQDAREPAVAPQQARTARQRARRKRAEAVAMSHLVEGTLRGRLAVEERVEGGAGEAVGEPAPVLGRQAEGDRLRMANAGGGETRAAILPDRGVVRETGEKRPGSYRARGYLTQSVEVAAQERVEEIDCHPELRGSRVREWRGSQGRRGASRRCWAG